MKWVILVLLLLPLAHATSITLLAYGEDGGSTATLTLDTQPGEGRVFVETNTLVDTDTQASFLLAKDIVCEDYDLPCADKDFFYTVTSASPSVTGPSGGTAAAVLTYAHMKGKVVPNIAITGTINSGGFVGAIGGLKEKLLAAKDRNISKIYAPVGNQRLLEGNSSINVTDFAFENNISVQLVGTTHDILVDLFGIKNKSFAYEKPEIFQDKMSSIAQSICDRAKSISVDATNLSTELLNRSEFALSTQDYYAAASFCFGAAVDLRQEEFQNYSVENIEAMLAFVQESAHAISNASTQVDIEVQSIVDERLQDAADAIQEAQNATNESVAKQSYAYAYERLFTAKVWSSFYNITDSETVDVLALPVVCDEKIQEAKRRVQYLRTYFTQELQADQSISDAVEAEQRGEFAYCILSAAKAKAEIEIVASVIGFEEKDVGLLLGVKKQIAQELIAERLSEGEFPLLGLSYIEYGASLEKRDTYSALLYYQLAAELSDVRLPAPADEQWHFFFGTWQYFFLGIAAGLITAGIGIKTYEAANRSQQPHRKKR